MSVNVSAIRSKLRMRRAKPIRRMSTSDIALPSSTLLIGGPPGMSGMSSSSDIKKRITHAQATADLSRNGDDSSEVSAVKAKTGGRSPQRPARPMRFMTMGAIEVKKQDAEEQKDLPMNSTTDETDSEDSPSRNNTTTTTATASDRSHDVRVSRMITRRNSLPLRSDDAHAPHGYSHGHAHTASDDAAMILFEVNLAEFEEILVELKASHSSFVKLMTSIVDEHTNEAGSPTSPTSDFSRKGAAASHSKVRCNARVYPRTHVSRLVRIPSPLREVTSHACAADSNI